MHVFSRNSLILIFLIAILICGLFLTGCVSGRFSPHGWAGPTVSGNTLYVCSLKGKFLAIDLSDHANLRDFTPQGQEQPSSLFGCSGPSAPKTICYATPVVSGSMFFAGTYAGDIYALDTTNGAKKWDYSTNHSIVGGLAISGDALVVPSGDKLYGFNARTGSLLWDKPFDTGGKIWATPVISGSTVYFGSLDHKLYAVNLDSGKKKWEEGFDGAIASTVLKVDETLYFGTFGKKFYALDAATGDPKWPEPFHAESWFWNRAAFSDGTVFVGSLNGKIYAIDAETGTLKWKYDTETGDRIRSAPVIVADVLVVGSQDDKIYGLDPETGTQKWAPLHFTNDILANPWVDGTTIYFLDQDNELHALDAQTGKQIWTQSLDLE